MTTNLNFNTFDGVAKVATTNNSVSNKKNANKPLAKALTVLTDSGSNLGNSGSVEKNRYSDMTELSALLPNGTKDSNQVQETKQDPGLTRYKVAYAVSVALVLVAVFALGFFTCGLGWAILLFLAALFVFVLHGYWVFDPMKNNHETKPRVGS